MTATVTSGQAIQSAATHETYRLTIVDSLGSHVLVHHDKSGWHLPEVTIPKFHRTLELITSHVFSALRLSTTLLLWELPVPNASTDFHHMMLEGPRQCNSVPGHTWCTMRDVASLLKQENAPLIERCRHHIVSASNPDTAPFARLGWIYTLGAWVEDVLHGEKLTSFQQLGGGDDTCLIRFTTSSKTLWYKAVGRLDSREFTNVIALTKRLPQYLPPIRAFDPALKGWLMENGGETTLREHKDPNTWTIVARALACLQKESVCCASELSHSGFIDLGQGALLERIDAFFEFMNGLMRQQVKTSPAPLTREQLSATAAMLRAAISELDDLAIPPTIGNSDFNPGNILISQESNVFVDWSAAHVGSPVLTLEYLLAHLKKNYPNMISTQETVSEVYLQQWLPIVPEPRMRRAMQFAPLVAAYASAIASDSWRDPARLAMTGLPGYLRSLGRIMNREAQTLSQRMANA